MNRAITIVPAIDLRGGRCVRLAQGDPDRETSYDDDPAARARAFVAAGARRLHVVDLDGAFGSGENLAALQAIRAAVGDGVTIQTGGGVRSATDISARLAAGADAVILGTVLANAPDAIPALLAEFGERLIAGVDARGGRVAVQGWLGESTVSRERMIAQIDAWGFSRIVFTEIARDGMGTGYDLDALAAVARATRAAITASGGAKTIDDVRALQALPANVDAAIVGRALYEGTLDLAEAIAVTRD